MSENTQLATIEKAQKQFELACQSADTIAIVQNASAAFTAVNVVKMLREALSKEVMESVFMPLMNCKIGYLTDCNGRPNSRGEVKPLYSIEVVRDCLIDACSVGLLPTGNQFNIIAGRAYPTKEGYTALLKKAEVKYLLNIGIDKGTNQNFAEIPVTVNYEFKGEKNSFLITTTVKKDTYSSPDQLRGKAERKAKKQLYEYVTGCDFGDADETSSSPISEAEVISTKVNATTEKLDIPKQEEQKQQVTGQTKIGGAIPEAKPAQSATNVNTTPPPTQQAAKTTVQPNTNFDAKPIGNNPLF